MGHSMTMITILPSILASFEGLRSFVFRQLVIASSRDYDLLFCFVLPRYFACITWPFCLGNQVDETLGVLVCKVLSFFMHFVCLELGHAICFDFVLSYKTLVYYHGISKQ